MQALQTRPAPAKVPAIIPPLSREDQNALAALLAFVRQVTPEDLQMAEAPPAESVAVFEELVRSLPYFRSLLPPERQQAFDLEDTAFARVSELEPEATALARQFGQMPSGAEKNDLLQRLNQLTSELALRIEDLEGLRSERRRHTPGAGERR